MSTSESSYLTLSQVAVRTGRHPELLRQWCAAGRVPCTRVGSSWVMLERDLPLVDGIASRRGRARTPSPPPPSTGAGRILAAVFEDPAAATAAADSLRERFHLGEDAVGTSAIDVPAVPALSLTVVAARMPGASVVNARRVLGAFGGRIVADIEEIRSPSPEVGPSVNLAMATGSAG
jgi:hypothetical protein